MVSGRHPRVNGRAVGCGDEQLEFALRYYRQLARVDSYVREHLHETFSLRNVAEAVGLSPSRLSHVFRDKTGTRFCDWLRAKRVHKAQELIETTDLSVTALARAVGFRDIRTLERAFRTVLDTTPRAYRKNVIRRQ